MDQRLLPRCQCKTPAECRGHINVLLQKVLADAEYFRALTATPVRPLPPAKSEPPAERASSLR